MRGPRMITIDGVTRCAREWARLHGTAKSTFLDRLAAGEAPAVALTRPPRTPETFAYQGEPLPVLEISYRSGVPVDTLRSRLRRHGSSEEAITAYYEERRGKHERVRAVNVTSEPTERWHR